MSESALHTPFPTGVPWLARALAVSALLHAIMVAIVVLASSSKHDDNVELVDIELAPPPPKAEALPEEHERKAAGSAAEEAAHAGAVEQPAPPEEPGAVAIDAGVDAPVDARVDAPIDAAKKRKPDAAIDAAIDAAEPMVASADGGASDAEQVAAVVADAATVAVTATDAATATAAGSAAATGSASASASASASGSGSGTAAGSASGSGTGTAIAMTGTGSGSGVGSGAETGSGTGSGSDLENDPAVAGAPTTAGTAANLLSYFPAGHIVTALVRFDRLRGTEWAAATEKLFRPLPDYRGLFGERAAAMADKLDMLVISSPRPKDATATTLVAKSTMSRRQVREFLANPETPIAWSTAKGGVVGKRSGKLFVNDRRVVLSPWKGWFLLAQPADLGALADPAKGNLETAEARAKLPPWLDGLRDIEKESGDDKAGPALVVTLTAPRQRYNFPDVGVGVTTMPGPERVSVAVELVKQGWLVRGNIKFGSEADAAEFEKTVAQVQQRVADSHLLAALLRKQHVLDVVRGLSIARAGDRVSYATSISIVDARAVLTAAAATISEYFHPAP